MLFLCANNGAQTLTRVKVCSQVMRENCEGFFTIAQLWKAMYFLRESSLDTMKAQLGAQPLTKSKVATLSHLTVAIIQETTICLSRRHTVNTGRRKV